MEAEKKQSALRLIMLIASPKITQKAIRLFKEGGVPIYYEFFAKGTATSETMDMLGLGNIDKRILLSVMPQIFTEKMLYKMNRELELNTANSGIAFSVVIAGGGSRILQTLDKLEQNEILPLERSVTDVSESNYMMVMSITNQGYSQEVMDSARSAGATGGTVFHARQAVDEKIMNFWGIQIQPEREITIILAKKEDNLAIMQAISQKCGIKSEAKGIVFSLPVESVLGVD